MVSTRYDSVWELMKRKDFQLVTVISDEYKCIICQNILINACSAPCGCRFCMDCIHNYLNGSDQYCPGDMENCKEDIISFVRDIQVDHAINTRITKLVVKCPEELCEFQNELKKIEDHLHTCKLRKARCPYYNIGCTNVEMPAEQIREHLSVEACSHTKMLMECINNLRNEIGFMKIEMEKLKRDAEIRQVAIFNLETEKIKMGGQLKEVIDEILEIKQLKHKHHMDNEHEERSEILNKNQRKRKHEGDAGDLIEIKTPKTESYVVNQDCNDFVWVVDKFSQKQRNAQNGTNAEIFSEPFYSHRNGYKMRLVMCPCGSGSGKHTHLSVFFQIMRGEFDALLSWPMKDKVTVTMVSHDTGIFQVIRHYQYDSLPEKIRFTFDKPKSDCNTSCGNPKFILLDTLLSDSSLYKNDQIILKCSVSMDP